MNEAVGAVDRKQGMAQSAESVVAIALLCVCAAAGLAAWLLSGDDKPAISADRSDIAKVASVQGDERLQSEEQAVLAEWQRRLDGEFSQREQNERQLALAKIREREAPAKPVESKPATAANKAASAVAAIDTVPASIDWNSCARPEYPEESVRFGQQGTVTMSFVVDAEGNASEGKVVETSGTRRLDYRALSALSRCDFEPERVNGKPVASVAQVRFTWKLTR